MRRTKKRQKGKKPIIPKTPPWMKIYSQMRIGEVINIEPVSHGEDLIQSMWEMLRWADLQKDKDRWSLGSGLGKHGVRAKKRGR